MAEDGEDAVALALALDDVAIQASHAGKDDRVVAYERCPHAVGLVLPQARAALDVGQEESYDARRQCTRRFHVRVIGQLGPRLKRGTRSAQGSVGNQCVD